MKRKLHTAEQIVKKLRQADAIIASGGTVEQACKQFQISDATYYKWRKQYGQMKLNQVKQLKTLQKENTQLKKLVADLSLDNADTQRSVTGKLLSPARKRKAVEQMEKRWNFPNVGHAEVLDQPRMTQRYKTKQPDRDKR